MFDKLKNVFSNITKNFNEKIITEHDISEIIFNSEIKLLESDVALEIIDQLKTDLKTKLANVKTNKQNIGSLIKTSLFQIINNLFDDVGTIDIHKNILHKPYPGPYIIVFVGINGTGKTTTLAKIAHMLKQYNISLVIAASDTYRAGAIEQLHEHANSLHIKFISQHYDSDPAAVAKDAVIYATSHKIDCVLIDTAGRIQTSKNLMNQISKIMNVVKPHLKIFVGDSLAGNDTLNQAKEFHEYIKFNASILTKADADSRGGSALSIMKITNTPVIYLGTGQNYYDLEKFDKKKFCDMVFNNEPDNINTNKTTQHSQISSIHTTNNIITNESHKNNAKNNIVSKNKKKFRFF